MPFATLQLTIYITWSKTLWLKYLRFATLKDLNSVSKTIHLLMPICVICNHCTLARKKKMSETIDRLLNNSGKRSLMFVTLYSILFDVRIKKHSIHLNPRYSRRAFLRLFILLSDQSIFLFCLVNTESLIHSKKHSMAAQRL